VTVVDSGHRVLSRDDPELSYLLEEALKAEGIEFRFGTTVEKLERSAGIMATLSRGHSVSVDAVLLAVGRRVDVSSLNLRAAGIRVTEDGIRVDARCRTEAPGIYACGDCTWRWQFTHMAEHMARVAVWNAVAHRRLQIDERVLTWCTYTDPELARVGPSEDELKKRDARYEIYRYPFSKVDRAVTDGRTQGVVKVFAHPRSGKIYSATILGPQAGDLIAEYALAIQAGLKLRDISATIHPYPTYAWANRRAADQWLVRRNASLSRRLLAALFGLRGAPRQPDVTDEQPS
jgi:pyruvate/2-oxoglutarate dehydrogenase complex dihydrolipoamide dehydrogenase (E3) component